MMPAACNQVSNIVTFCRPMQSPKCHNMRKYYIIQNAIFIIWRDNVCGNTASVILIIQVIIQESHKWKLKTAQAANVLKRRPL